MSNPPQTYVGNGKKISISTNSGVLRVIGNNCFVTVTNNQGQITVTGNNGHLQVSENTGTVCYTGNNGLIEVGKTSKGIGQVVYTGNGGIVKRMKSSSSDSEKCSVKRTNSKSSSSQHEPKKDGSNKIKKEVKSELRVNGVEVCMNSKSNKNFSRGNEGPEKVKRTSSTRTSSCCQQARTVLWPSGSVKTGIKTSRISLSPSGIIELVNVNNFELENWCLNIASEVVAL